MDGSVQVVDQLGAEGGLCENQLNRGERVMGVACFAKHSYSGADASTHAHAQFGRILDQQASFLASLDCFWLLGRACLIRAPLAFLTRKFKSAGPGAGH
jgi:hypothetical protein